MPGTRPLGALVFICTDCFVLKLYCGYKYRRPYMINRIWCLKQLWLHVKSHAWFHLHGHRWAVRNGEGAENSKWKYMSPAGFEPTPRHSTTGELAVETALLDDDLWYNVLRDSGIQINETITWQHVSNWLWLHCIWTYSQTKSTFRDRISM